MSKFKVGDRVRIVKNGWFGRHPVGHIGCVTDVFDGGVRIDDGGGNNYPNSNIEHLAQNTIQLNHQYTSKNGQKWECIAIKGDVCWLASACGEGDAYRFLTNGENLSQAGGVWDIKWEPVIEWVEYMSDINISEPQADGFYIFTETAKVNIRFPKIDGEPDFTQATVNPV